MKKENVAVEISRNVEIVDMLDRLLTESDDRAYIVCPASDCQNNVKGRCSIHTIKGTRKMANNNRCLEYVV